VRIFKSVTWTGNEQARELAVAREEVAVVVAD
jgi:hypothetical protein